MKNRVIQRVDEIFKQEEVKEEKTKDLDEQKENIL